MKKLISLIVTLVLIVSMSVVVAVTVEDLTQTTEVKDAGIIIKAPTDWHILTRDLTADTPGIVALNIDPAALKTQFEYANIYYNALPADATSELVVTMLSNVQTKLSPGYNESTQEQLELVMQTVLDTVVEESETTIGSSYTSANIYKNDTATYVVAAVEQIYSGNTIYGRVYNTNIYGRNYNITFNSYTGAITPEQEELIKVIVDNTEFTESIETAVVDEPDTKVEDDETVEPDTTTDEEGKDTDTDTDTDTVDDNKDTKEKEDDSNTILIISIIAGAVVLIGSLITGIMLAKKKK